MVPIRSRIRVSRQEKACGRCHSIVAGLRRPEKPGYGTRRAASRAHRPRCVPLVMRRHHGAGRALPGALAKPSYGYPLLDFIHYLERIGVAGTRRRRSHQRCETALPYSWRPDSRVRSNPPAGSIEPDPVWSVFRVVRLGPGGAGTALPARATPTPARHWVSFIKSICYKIFSGFRMALGGPESELLTRSGTASMVRAFEDLESVRTANHRCDPAEFLENTGECSYPSKGSSSTSATRCEAM